MGYFGLILDNVIDMTVVLANGDIIHVSSTSHPDLYWGMRGAGQNLGIVTEAHFKIYDFPTPTWFYAEFDFPDADSQLEPLFTRINRITANSSQPKELGSLYVYSGINPRYSKTDVSRHPWHVSIPLSLVRVMANGCLIAHHGATAQLCGHCNASSEVV